MATRPAGPVCHDWLVRQPAAVMFAPEFCPNARIPFELEINQPVTGHRQRPLPASASA
jgi:hypothetical protein